MSSQEVVNPRREIYARVPEEQARRQTAVIVENLRLYEAENHSSLGSEDDETNSLVSSEAELVFRKSPWADGTDETSRNAGDTNPSALQVLNVSRSRSHHTDDSDIEGSDWEDDDEAGIRRYHLGFETVRTDMPLPAEFSHESVPKRIWQSFLELRTAARQRRAARLLTMPSQSWIYQTHACLLTSCCDATDLGILLAAVSLSIWLFVGLAAGMGSSWWWTGLLLFLLRISARRFFEFCQAKRRKQRQRLSTGEGMELGDAAASVFRDDGKGSDHQRTFGEVL